MKRSAAIITATFAVLAMSSCSAVRQLDRIDTDGGTPTPTTVYVIDIGEPEFPTIPSDGTDTGVSPEGCGGGSECPPLPTATPQPPCQSIHEGVCLPEGCGGMADCGPAPQGSQADYSDCTPEGLEVGACH